MAVPRTGNFTPDVRLTPLVSARIEAVDSVAGVTIISTSELKKNLRIKNATRKQLRNWYD